MKKKIIKYTLLIFGIFISAIIYLSLVGLETEKFNSQIKSKLFTVNNKLDLKLKKIKLTLDPLNFKINAKTIGAKIIYQKKILELEYIKTQISLNSLFKNKLVSSNLDISTKSIPLKDLIRFMRAISNKPELFFLERMIEKGYVIANLEFNFDENGKIKNDYQIKGLLKDGIINFSKDYNFKNLNFILNVKNNIFNFKDINFRTNEMNFFSDNLKVTQNKNNLLFEGVIENKDSDLSNKLISLTKLNLKNINFNSKNNFSFNVNNKFKLMNLAIDSEIHINELQYSKPDILNDYFSKIQDKIYFKDHKIKARYKKNDFYAKGLGKIQLQEKFDKIEYLITNKDKDFKLVSNIILSELNIKGKKLFKNFFPKINNDEINLKDHQVLIEYKDKNLFFKGHGKIKIENEFDIIDYSISKIRNKINFDTKLNLDKTSLNLIFLNYIKDIKSKTEVILSGTYEKDKELKLKKISILSKNNQIIFENFLLDKDNKIIKIDKIDLDYYDIENKKNQFLIKRDKENNYQLSGSIFNANTLISNLLKSKDVKQFEIFKNNMNLNLNIGKVYIYDENIVRDVKGKLFIKNNKVFQTNISALFNNNKNLTFTINTNANSEKITTLFSARAKPLVDRYKFIKGYEGGYLDFYSSKKNKISNSVLKIYDFKLQELPTLTKLLTLASLQGIADLLSGEGIRFDEFEMNFNNKDNLMTIDEIYAIGPSISVLMSGYVEEDKLVSLRGTLVPATTINKTISLIPLFGKILVGDKRGEGVFGVSFKIKGSPDALETNVNPIKTLTPRFITRTLEKIKRN